MGRFFSDESLHALTELGAGTALLAGAALAAALAHRLAIRLLGRLLAGTRLGDDQTLRRHGFGASRALLTFLAVGAVLPAADFPPKLMEVLRRLTSIGGIASFAFVLARGADLVAEVALKLLTPDPATLRARKLSTQITVFRRLFYVVVALIAIPTALMTFERFRELGTSILASAGLLGVVVGFASQKTLGLVISGMQIAIAQPIRMGDLVVVEGEFGRIDEITFTYVVVRLWDQRRLVLPISYFNEKPFQNWTRDGQEISGAVLLHVDFLADVEAIREEFLRVLKGSPLWDGRLGVLQVTEAGERVLQLRGLVSAASASELWDLRCEVREKLVRFVATHCPEAAPLNRVLLEDGRKRSPTGEGA